MPKPFSAQERDLIQQRLLAVGRRLFAQFGLKKTSLEQITSQVGISKGAFYLFYDSKESLYLTLVEQSELAFRERILDAIQPGESPRRRLAAVFQYAFTHWRGDALLQQIRQPDYLHLMQAIPPERLQMHLEEDQAFIRQLVDECRAAGIPIQAPLASIGRLMNALFFVSLHQEDFGPQGYSDAMDLLIDLAAAYCLGQVPEMDT